MSIVVSFVLFSFLVTVRGIIPCTSNASCPDYAYCTGSICAIPNCSNFVCSSTPGQTSVPVVTNHQCACSLACSSSAGQSSGLQCGDWVTDFFACYPVCYTSLCNLNGTYTCTGIDFGLCEYPVATCTHFPSQCPNIPACTASPTSAPTNTPTNIEDSAAPTGQTTSFPTNQPTSAPTNTPTAAQTTCIPLVNGIPTITMRQFSNSPTLGNGGPTMNTNPSSLNYGALRFFIEYVNQYTAEINETVNFVIGAPWSVSSVCPVITQVGQTNNVCPQHMAAYDAGTELDDRFGFIMKSGTPFAMPFSKMKSFLFSSNTVGRNESGIQMVQRILDNRGKNVHVLPVVGSPGQSSGFFKVDASNMNGFSELCRGNYTFRYLSPGMDILNRTCFTLFGNTTKVNFIEAVSGQPISQSVQQGFISAFEYGAALDNFRASQGGFFPNLQGPSPYCVNSSNPLLNNPPPNCFQNPGQKGIRFVHYPSFNENYFIGWVMINKNIWNCLSDNQKTAITKAAKDAFDNSYSASMSAECPTLRKMLSFNDNEIQRNPDGTAFDCNTNVSGIQTCSADMKMVWWSNTLLSHFRNSTNWYLNSLRGNSSSSQRDYGYVLDQYLAYQEKINGDFKGENGCYKNLS